MLYAAEKIHLPNEALPRHSHGQLGVQHLQGHVFALVGRGEENSRGSSPGDLALDGELVAELVVDQRYEVTCDFWSPGIKKGRSSLCPERWLRKGERPSCNC